MKDKAIAPYGLDIQKEQAISPSIEAIKLVTYEQAKRARAVPIKLQRFRDQTTIAFVTDAGAQVGEIQKELKFITGLDAKGVIVSKDLFDKSLAKAYVEGGHVLAGIVKECPPIKPLPSNNLTIVASTPALRLLDAIVQYAVAKSASDIHLVPEKESVRIELRINGEMFRSKESVSHNGVYKELLNRLKILAGIDVTKILPIADGRFAMNVAGAEVNARLSLISTTFGERVTIRIAQGLVKSLEELNVCEEAINFLSTIESEPSGGVLVSGATGSGKSSLIYGFIKRLANNLSISTIEDPIEIRIPGIAQTEVGKSGISYESGLSAILRHDPDVIMIGEIRSSETAITAVQAMLSGHLVLSTLHAGGIFEMLLRLRGLGVSSLDISEATRMLVNVALIPKLCDCKVIDLDGSNLIGMRLFKRCGCYDCDFTGYAGRLPALDILCVDGVVRSALLELTSEAILRVSSSRNSLYKSTQLERYLVSGEVSLRDCQGLVGAVGM
jgi:type II secretory ATPase GspE/PulE/Tfp pilus assembly ATPase PilB-like protein